MRKQREKVSIKAAALILGVALLTGGCSGYQSSEELRKGKWFWKRRRRCFWIRERTR